MNSLNTVARFLYQAAGFAPSEPVVITFYGGAGSDHLRWQSKINGGGARPIVWETSVRDEVASQLHDQLKKGRQLGFIAAHGGSKKDQITHVNALRAEIDLPDSKDLQKQVYAAVEKYYGIKFTLLDTGGKSLHAWVPLNESIQAGRYKETSTLWHENITQITKEVGLELPERAFDPACHRPTQVMRLPGSIHLKTGRIAEVIQWGDGPVSLEDLGLGWPQVEEWAKRKEKPKRLIQKAIASQCQPGVFMGLAGDARLDELVSLARSVPVRIPGTGSYGTVLSLVMSLSQALGPEEAAQILHRAEHQDKQGRRSLDGLKQWCGTFEHQPERAEEQLSWLATWAERKHGWKRPILIMTMALEPTKLVMPNSDAICDALFKHGGALVVCQTGTGKSEGACGYVERISKDWAKARDEFSAVMITPRRTINGQFAQKLSAVNVSGKLTGKGDPYCQPGTQPNRYVCCLQSLGNPIKRNGQQKVWGEYQSLGDAGSRPVPTGRGTIATVLILDEFRQILTDLLLSPSGPGTLWEKPADRWKTGIALVRSISCAGVILAMDAQAGEPERELLRAIGRSEGGRVLGCPTTVPTRKMSWTSDKKRWRDCLIGHAKARSETDKPLLVVTGTKGIDGQGQRGLSARAIRKALRSEIPEISILIIDAESKDSEAAQRVLHGDVNGWDVVICTPVAQSGVSWVGVFDTTVYVAGGRTLPPNICGGQAGRRERTATTCVAYVPKTTWDRSLPVWGREEDTIRDELTQARVQAADLPISCGREIELLERIYVMAARRQIEELALFSDYTLHYAKIDGWALEELAEVVPLTRPRGAEGIRQKRAEPLAYNELDLWRELLVRSLRLQASGAEREVAETKVAALRATEKRKEGSAGADLLSANLSDVQNLLLASGLGHLCDGSFRPADDPEVKAVAQALRTSKAARVLRNANWLQINLKGNGERPSRTIGTVVKSLGGITETRKTGPRREQQRSFRWLLPGQTVSTKGDFY